MNGIVFYIGATDAKRPTPFFFWPNRPTPQLVEEFPAIVEYRRELGVNQFELARTLHGSNSEEAEVEFTEAVTSLERLIAENPNHIRTKRELASSLEHWGGLIKEIDFEGAVTAMNKARKLRLELHESNRLNPTLRDELFVSDNNLANVYRINKEYAAAIPIYESLLKTLSNTDEAEEDPMYNQKLRIVRFGLGDSLSKSNEFERALPHWTELTANHSDPSWANFELQRAICLIRTGDTEQGISVATAVLETPDVPPVLVFDTACCYAIAAEMHADDSDQAEKYRDQALLYLEKAGEQGFFDDAEMRKHAGGDNDLDSLKNDPRFKAFCQKYEIVLESGE